MLSSNVRWGSKAKLKHLKTHKDYLGLGLQECIFFVSFLFSLFLLSYLTIPKPLLLQTSLQAISLRQFPTVTLE